MTRTAARGTFRSNANPRRNLARWIHRVLTRYLETGATCSAIALVHYEGETEEILHQVQFGSRPCVPAKLSEMIHRIGQEHANAHLGVQHYQVKAFYAGSTPEAHYPMSKTPADIRPDVIAPVQGVMQLLRGSNLGVVDARRVVAIARERLLDAETWADVADRRR